MKTRKPVLLLLIFLLCVPALAQQQDEGESLEDRYAAAVDEYWSYENDFDLTIEMFSTIIEENPKFVEAYIYRGSVYRVQENFEAAQAI